MAIQLGEEEKNLVYRYETMLRNNDFKRFIQSLVRSGTAEHDYIGNIIMFCLQNGIDVWTKTDVVYPYMFYNCREEEPFEIPEGILRIGEYAFADSSFRSVKLPSTLQKIGGRAFNGMENLREIYIPENVTDIGPNCFGEDENIIIKVNRDRKYRLGIPKKEVDWYRQHIQFID